MQNSSKNLLAQVRDMICLKHYGENVVQGAVNPDEFLVFKPTLTDGFRPILQKRLGSKAIKLRGEKWCGMIF